MPAIDPKSLPANLQPGAPSRNITPQEMMTAVAELKNKPGAKGLNPDDSPVGLRPNFTRPTGFVEEAPPQMPPQMPQAAPPMTRQMPTPARRPPMRPTGPRQLMKKGGEAKAYASGGSVKGAGIAQRGVRKCKMV